MYIHTYYTEMESYIYDLHIAYVKWSYRVRYADGREKEIIPAVHPLGHLTIAPLLPGLFGFPKQPTTWMDFDPNNL